MKNRSQVPLTVKEYLIKRVLISMTIFYKSLITIEKSSEIKKGILNNSVNRVYLIF